MLKLLPSILGPELLMHLRSMGHGDEVVIVDANFPAETFARRLVRSEASLATEMLDAVLTVLPLDRFVECPVHTMQVVGSDRMAPIAGDFTAIVRTRSPEFSGEIGAIERHAFYERARDAFLIIATGEHRLYGNILLKKGVIER